MFFSLEFFFCACISQIHCIESVTLSRFESVTSSKGTPVVQFLSPFPTKGLICHVSSILGYSWVGVKLMTILQIGEAFLTLSFQRAISTSCAPCGFYGEQAFINACLDVGLHCFQQILHNCCKRSSKDCISPWQELVWC